MACVCVGGGLGRVEGRRGRNGVAGPARLLVPWVRVHVSLACGAVWGLGAGDPGQKVPVQFSNGVRVTRAMVGGAHNGHSRLPNVIQTAVYLKARAAQGSHAR